MKLKTLITLTSTSIALCLPQASAALSAGDIAIVGWESDNNDQLSFVAFVDLDPGETIWYFNHGYLGGGDSSGEGSLGGTYNGTENIASWSNDTGSTITAGTVITIDNIFGGSGLDSNGDQLFLATGSLDGSNNLNGELLFGLDFSGTDGWDTTISDPALDSLEPSALGSNQLTFAHVDNGYYTGSHDFTDAESARLAILDSSNWTTGDKINSLPPFDSTPIVIPEPTVLTSFFLGSLALIWNRRKRKG